MPLALFLPLNFQCFSAMLVFSLHADCLLPFHSFLISYWWPHYHYFSPSPLPPHWPISSFLSHTAFFILSILLEQYLTPLFLTFFFLQSDSSLLYSLHLSIYISKYLSLLLNLSLSICLSPLLIFFSFGSLLLRILSLHLSISLRIGSK